MIRKITFLLTVSLFASLMAVAQSFTAVYPFDSVKINMSGLTDPTAVPTAIGVTFGSFVCVSDSATNPNASSRFSFTKWPTGGVNGNDSYASLTGAINTTEYYQVTITPVSGFAVTLSSITFTSQRSGTGIRTYAVRSSADAYAANLSASIVPADTNLSVQTGNVFFWTKDATTSAQDGNTITLSGAGFTSFTGAKTFRFYGWNAEASGGTFSIDNVTFTGSTVLANSVDNVSKAASVSVYPNPSMDGVFTIATPNDQAKTTLTVCNIIGEKLITKEFGAGVNVTVDLSGQPNGNYFFTIKNDKEVITKKVVINK
jgi:hypothetical protein